MEATKRTSSKGIDVVQIVDHISKKQKLDKNVSTNIDITISKETIDNDKSSIENNFTDDNATAAADNTDQATRIETKNKSAEKNVAVVNENKIDENVENDKKNVDNKENRDENKNKNENESTTENEKGNDNVKTKENSEYSEQVIDPVFGSHGISSNTNEGQTESQSKTQIATQTETRTEAQIETKITTDNHPLKQKEDEVEEEELGQKAKQNEEQKDQIALVSTPISNDSIPPPKKSNMADPDMLIKIKKLNHKEVERRRRETINNAIRELQEMVPTTHTNKAQVIKKASEYIKKLKDKQENLLNKWTLEKIITDQAVNELSNSNNKLKTELERAYREIEHRKNVFENFTEMVSKQSNSEEVTEFLSKVDELFLEEEEEEEVEEDDDNEGQQDHDHVNVDDNEEDSNDTNIEQNLEAKNSNEIENKMSNEENITVET